MYRLPTPFTVSAFEATPERDYIDTETHRVPLEHLLLGHAFHRGSTYILFLRNVKPLQHYRCNVKDLHPTAPLMAERELERLGRVLEAVMVLNGNFLNLPMKVAVAGRTVYRPMYSHPNQAVRYPLLGMDPDTSRPGKRQREQIVAYLAAAGFDEHTTAHQVVGIMESVVQTEEYMMRTWDAEMQAWPTSPEIVIEG